MTADLTPEWKLVPREPTAEMREAGLNAQNFLGAIWRHMYDAAPQPPAPETARAPESPTSPVEGVRPSKTSEVLMWLDERGQNSRSFGSHADAYEIAARKLREAIEEDALSRGEPGDQGARAVPSAVVEALRNLVAACERADALEELHEEIDGSLLDAANSALAGLPPAYSNQMPSTCCEGETCFCGMRATAKVEETIFADDWSMRDDGPNGGLPRMMRGRHPLTSYVCADHFAQIMHRGRLPPNEGRLAGSESPVDQERRDEDSARAVPLSTAQVAELVPIAKEMLRITRAIGEGDDWGAAWESIFPAMGLDPGDGELETPEEEDAALLAVLGTAREPTPTASSGGVGREEIIRIIEAYRSLDREPDTAEEAADAILSQRPAPGSGTEVYTHPDVVEALIGRAVPQQSEGE